jgi:asparagine synthase (glutamine-hydrolysing)
MTDALVHRGPDDQGTWTGDGFAFGARRLSIIDLAGGHQPIWDRRTRIGMVYNGAIYNYKALRASLEKSGVKFHTTSDTEVALQSVVMHGPDAVRDWNGMFAVATWDDRHKNLLLIRDRFGVKPLYYYWDGSMLLFASEIKALLAATLVPRRVNRQALWDYLTFRYVPGPATMWENVWKLPPGHRLEWTPGRTPRLSQYWQSDVVSPDEPFDITQKTKEFEDLFLASVSARLLASDVPVGVMLSGGLDSSAIAAAAAELGHKLQTFTVGFADGGDYSELEYARAVVNHLDLENHEVVVDQRRFLEILPEAVRAADEPLADPAIVPMLAVMQLTHGHVKVALSGEGSDEVLAGYDLHVVRRKFDAIRQIQRIPSSLLAQLSRALRHVSAEYARTLGVIASVPLSRRNVVSRNHMTWSWIEAEKSSLWPTFAGRDSEFILREMYAQARSLDPLDQMLAVMQKSWLVEDLLMKADKMSMAAAVELRTPFLDYRLVEWANRQPLGVKIGRLHHRTVTKHVLRRFAMHRLPRAIIQRPKRGFPVPIRQWLAENRFRAWAHQHVLGKEAKIAHLFQQEEIQRQLHRAAAGDHDAANKSWLLLVVETWLQQFQVEVKTEVMLPEGERAPVGIRGYIEAATVKTVGVLVYMNPWPEIAACFGV